MPFGKLTCRLDTVSTKDYKSSTPKLLVLLVHITNNIWGETVNLCKY